MWSPFFNATWLTAGVGCFSWDDAAWTPRASANNAQATSSIRFGSIVSMLCPFGRLNLRESAWAHVFRQVKDRLSHARKYVGEQSRQANRSGFRAPLMRLPLRVVTCNEIARLLFN